MTAVLGALEHYETWSRIYTGLRVDFGDQGLYHDAVVGPNWWEYYFEPISIGTIEHAAVATIDLFHHDMFTRRAEAMSRADAHRLIARYVHPKRYISEKLDAYARAHFAGRFVIGVHYRGTDKHEEAPRVPYDDVVAAAREALDQAGGERCRLFVATDEQPFLDYMLGLFPDQVLYRQVFRSTDGRPTHKTGGDGFKKGEDAVIDCMLLSRTDYLIRTASSLSYCATLFYPGLPETLLVSPGETSGQVRKPSPPARR
jgi:hypothetical protein